MRANSASGPTPSRPPQSYTEQHARQHVSDVAVAPAPPLPARTSRPLYVIDVVGNKPIKPSAEFVDSAVENRRKTTSIWESAPDYISISDDRDEGAAVYRDGGKGYNYESTVGERPPLCDEQLQIIEQAKNGRNICYVGSAGSGKSTVLHELRKQLEDQGKVVQVLSPTGIVALQINGITTYNFAGWTPNDAKRSLKELVIPQDDDDGKQRGMKKARLRRLSVVDVIIIDEISMVENSFFTRLDFLLKEAKGWKDKAFGGAQIIITGDFFQLPPVLPIQHCVTCGTELRDSFKDQRYRSCRTCECRFKKEAKFAFCSDAWEECDFLYMTLKKIHRQTDARFRDLLQKCREGSRFTNDDIDVLTRQKPGLDKKKATKLFPTKKEVRQVNRAAFDALPYESVEYRCYDMFIKQNKDTPNYFADKYDRPEAGTLVKLENHRWETKLGLKQSMRVMLLHNLDINGGLCNGSQGEVVGFEPLEDSKVPTAQSNSNPSGTIVGTYKHQREDAIRIFANVCKAQDGFPGWPVVQFDNGVKRTIYPECTANEVGTTRPYSLLCRAQVPLTAGYAWSIHKSQGMTLDNVIVNLKRSFEVEQIYVALSRARSLDGLLVEGLKSSEEDYGNRFDRTGREMVKRFYNEHFK
ncbi:P-loop containing nucleoside triphosphate hydrolase protein [Cladorrhinum sp. PSN259]|nr:P-loop containing nucleoside triphosphate hydrolase protein [Cladorrhinum sp. PSN259]